MKKFLVTSHILCLPTLSRNLNLKLPLTLKEFTCSPDEINFDAKKYVSAVRTEFEELVKNESLHYQIYIRTQKTVRRNSDKKYGFHIGKAADAFFGDILWAIKFFSETRECLHKIICPNGNATTKDSGKKTLG